MVFNQYQTDGYYDEFFDAQASPRLASLLLLERLSALSKKSLLQKQSVAETALLKMGLTFNVYGHQKGTEKIFPFDIIPRIISATEWKIIETGLMQRIKALNCFIEDIYNGQEILNQGVIPKDLVLKNPQYRRECQGFKPPKGIWIHISGSDIVRDKNGCFYVLEDNLRCPSGVSYVLKNREVMKQTFPRAFETMQVKSVDAYPNMLLETLEYATPSQVDHPKVVLLTPGLYNSAYFEHSFLAQQMGIRLVEGQDLIVQDDHVYVRTTKGYEQVDVIYRRVDDDFLDPLIFNPDSLLGVPGLMTVYKKGNVTLANAPGAGIADDKAIYSYVEQMIAFYLNEKPILSNVPTYLCRNAEDLNYVLSHLNELVIKPVDGAGGYGVVIGKNASEEELDELALAIKKNPKGFIAQPILQISRAPTIIGDICEGRHIDLRPYVLYGHHIHVLPGGLTRVALEKDSLIVNSSQGGGSKDTWIVEEYPHERADDLFREYRKRYAKQGS